MQEITTSRLLAMTLLFLCATTGFLPIQAFGASTCSPGAHWVDSCAAGTNTYSIVMRFGLTTNIQGFADYEAQFEGTMTVTRGDPVAQDPINDPSHLNYINTEIVSMVLAGTSPEVSGWTFRAGVDQGLAPTTGFIQETSDPNIAQDWSNLAFAIDGTPYGTLHQNGTLFFATLIDQLPSVGAVYKHTGSPFGTNYPLYDANNTIVLKLTDLFGTDWVTVGRPQIEIMGVVPLPPAFILLGSGLLGLLVHARFMRGRRKA